MMSLLGNQDEVRLSNVLPPLFLCVTIGTVWVVYVCLHLHPLLQLGLPREIQDRELFWRGVKQAVISQTLFVAFMSCYARAVLTGPGAIPDTVEWKMGPDPASEKFNADKRHCKWCLKYKPERAHHCRVCKRCVLKMDHHCPWIMNCVGFNNHKYFFLTVMYSAAVTGYIALTIYRSVLDSQYQDMPHVNRFFLTLGFVEAIFFAGLMSAFGAFHVQLILRSMTTLEYCEDRTGYKKAGRKGGSRGPGDGVFDRVAEVLGPNPLLWLVPVDTGRGDGVTFDRLGAAQAALRAGAEKIDYNQG